MRLLIAGTFSFPENGGAAARATHMQAKGLVELGHDVTVATCRGTLPQNQTDFDGFKVTSYNGTCKKMQSSLIAAWCWAYAQVKLLTYLVYSVLFRRFDSILFYGSAPIFVPIAFLGVLLNRHTCLIQGDLISIRKDMPTYSIWIESLLAKRVKLVIVNGSRLLLEHYKSTVPNVPKILTWPPTDVHYYRNGNHSISREQYNITGKPAIVYVGAINSLEGIDILLAAMKELVSVIPNAVLVLAGRLAATDPILGKPTDYLSLAEKLGLSHSVIFTGLIPMNEVANLLCAADVLVSPKIDHILNQVAAPIKMGEYLAANSPVVSTRVCDLEKWLTDREEVMFCDPGNVHQLFECFRELLDNKELAEKIGNNGFLAAEKKCHYSAWGSEVSKVLTLAIEKKIVGFD